MLEDTLPATSRRAVRSDAPTARMTTPGLSDCSTVQWDVYANGGGVQEDDARAFAKMKAEEAEYHARRASTPQTGISASDGRLIEISPVKAGNVSKNTNLLLELDIEPEHNQQMSRTHTSAASASFNLLD